MSTAPCLGNWASRPKYATQSRALGRVAPSTPPSAGDLGESPRARRRASGAFTRFRVRPPSVRTKGVVKPRAREQSQFATVGRSTPGSTRSVGGELFASRLPRKKLRNGRSRTVARVGRDPPRCRRLLLRPSWCSPTGGAGRGGWPGRTGRGGECSAVTRRCSAVTRRCSAHTWLTTRLSRAATGLSRAVHRLRPARG